MIPDIARVQIGKLVSIQCEASIFLTNCAGAVHQSVLPDSVAHNLLKSAADG